MGKLIIILFLCFIMIVMPVVHSIAQGPEAVEEWFSKLSSKKEKLTKLHFYFHDQVSGKNATTARVAQPNSTSNAPLRFGTVVMMDDALTVGPEPNSKIVGRAQGMYSSSDLKEISFLMSLTYVFMDGKYNGSTFSVLGRNPILHMSREMPIVGGTGVFRLARGIATAKTVWFNTTSLDAVVEYNVIVIHYDD